MNSSSDVVNPKFQLSVGHLSTTLGSSNNFSGISSSNTRLSDPGNVNQEQMDSLRRQSRTSVTQIRLQETLINVGSRDEEARKMWNKKISDNEDDYRKSAPFRRVVPRIEEHAVFSFFVNIISALLKVLISLPLSLVLMAVIPIAFLAKVVFSVIYYSSCSIRSKNHLNAHDAKFFLHETDSVLQSLIIIDGHLCLSHLRTLVAKRVIEARNTQYLSLLHPKLSQTVEFFNGDPVWKEAESFNVENHVFYGPTIENEDKMRQFVTNLLSQPLPLTKPLWEIIVINDYGDQFDTALVCRVHQCIGDGISLLRTLTGCLCDNQSNPPRSTHFGGQTFTNSCIGSFFVGPYTFLKWYFSSQEKNMLTLSRRYNRVCENIFKKRIKISKYNGRNSVSSELGTRTLSSAIENRYLVSWSRSFSVYDIYRIRRITKSSFNCVVLSALAGALRTTLQRKGISNPPDVKVSVGVDLKDNPENYIGAPLGTKTSHVPIVLPVSTEGAIPRIWAIREQLDELKDNSDAVISYLTTWWVYTCLPKSWASKILRRLQALTSMEYLSLTGNDEKLSIADCVLKHIFVMSPPRDPLTLCVSLVTYDECVYVTLIAKESKEISNSFIRRVLIEMKNQCEQLTNITRQKRLPDPSIDKDSYDAYVRQVLAKMRETVDHFETLTRQQSYRYLTVMEFLEKHPYTIKEEANGILINNSLISTPQNCHQFMKLLKEERIDEMTDFHFKTAHYYAKRLQQETSELNKIWVQTLTELRDKTLELTGEPPSDLELYVLKAHEKAYERSSNDRISSPTSTDRPLATTMRRVDLPQASTSK